MNPSQSKVALMSCGATRCGDAFVSTSLKESFGHALVEAESYVLSSYAFDLSVLPEGVLGGTVIVNLGYAEPWSLRFAGRRGGTPIDRGQP